MSNVPDRDAELGVGGNAAGTLTPSSRRSSLVSGQLLYHPANATVLEEPVQEQVSVRICYKVALTLRGSWCLELEFCSSGVMGPTDSDSERVLVPRAEIWLY